MTPIIEICIKQLQQKGHTKEDAEKLCTLEYAKLD